MDVDDRCDSSLSAGRVPLGRRLRARASSASPDSASACATGSVVGAAKLLGEPLEGIIDSKLHVPKESDTPSPDERQRVREIILSASASPCPLPRDVGVASPLHVVRRGCVRYRKLAQGFRFVERFGECADSKCGCYRPWRPDVRRRFRDACAQLTTTASGAIVSAAAARRAVRYVTFCSGQLLTDFELLCALVDRGLQIESIVAVDTSYSEARGDDCTVDGGNASAEAEALAALKQLAAFFAPAPCHSFSNLESFRRALTCDPATYGDATTVVKCDGGGLDEHLASAAARDALLPGGHYFVLTNCGGNRALNHRQAARDGEPGLMDVAPGSEYRQYWRAQLHDGSRMDAKQKPLRALPGAPLEPIDDVLRAFDEPPAAHAERQQLARNWLNESLADRACARGLSIYVVVFEGAPTRDGRAVPPGVRNTIAVRASPSRSARIVATRTKGDKVLVAEEEGGWVRLSEEDDQHAWRLSLHPPEEEDANGDALVDDWPRHRGERQAWILIDGKPFGVGRILHKEDLHGNGDERSSRGTVVEVH